MTDLRRSDRPFAEPTETPYVGLVPYQEEDADFFFGRDREIRIVTSNLRAHRLTILYGPSGAGKTSLIRAGVVHQLRRGTYARECSTRPSSVRDLHDRGVAGRSAAHADELDAGRSLRSPRALGRSPLAARTSVVRSLRAWTRRVRTLLIVLDQFEDYFLYHPDEIGEGRSPASCRQSSTSPTCA
jgi:hypothetical protein